MLMCERTSKDRKKERKKDTADISHMFSCVVWKGEGATRRDLKVFPKNMSSSDQFASHLKPL